MACNLSKMPVIPEFFIRFLFVLFIFISCSGKSGAGKDAQDGSIAGDSITETGYQEEEIGNGTDEELPQEISPYDGVMSDGEYLQNTDANDSNPDQDSYDPKCESLQSNWNNNFIVDGEPRKFILTLPKNVETKGAWPVVFNWHGYGDTASNMKYFLYSDVNTAGFSFILVTPEDTGLMPVAGMDWDILTVAETNREARLFDEIIKCLNQKWGIDYSHIHSIGFSAGAIATDMLGVLRGDMLASSVSYSGAYFSNDKNANAFTSWVSFQGTNPYTQIILHGGQSDSYNAIVTVLQFNEMAESDASYLNSLGHDVIICNHSGGHSIPKGWYPQNIGIIDFFKSHPKGIAGSPWVHESLPSFLPDTCEARKSVPQ
jgi:predicted esterase